MENMHYAEELLREFLVFRGFTSTLQSFEAESSTDIGRNFQVDKILDLIFKVYIPRYQADKLVGLLNFFKQCFSSPSDVVLYSTLLKLELSVLRYYVVHALQSGRQEKVIEFFGENGNYLLQKRDDWSPWFGGFTNHLSYCILFAFDTSFVFTNARLQCSYSLYQEPELGSSVPCLLFKRVV